MKTGNHLKTYFSCLMLMASFSSYGQQSKSNVPIKVDVASQQMDRALTEFSKETHIAVVFQSKDVTKFKSNTVKGSKIPFDAVVQLVRGSGLEVHPSKAGFTVNREDQQNFGLKAAELQAELNQAVKSQTMKQDAANSLFKQLSDVRTSVVELATKQGFVSAAEKASYQRTFNQVKRSLNTK